MVAKAINRQVGLASERLMATSRSLVKSAKEAPGAGEDLPDFDAMAESAMAEDGDDGFRPSDIDPDYADLDGAWRPQP